MEEGRIDKKWGQFQKNIEEATKKIPIFGNMLVLVDQLNKLKH